MTDKSSKQLERVRALLAKASSTTFPAEAEALLAKAHELMEQHAIDQWMVDAAQDRIGARPKPEIRVMNFDWWYKSPRYIDSALFTIFYKTAEHCRCVVADRGRGTEGYGDYHHMPVIGLPSDLDYFDMLFTHLMLQMGQQLDPKVNPNISVQENGYKLRAAGMDWMKAVRLLWIAGMLEAPRGKAGMRTWYTADIDARLKEDPTLFEVSRVGDSYGSGSFYPEAAGYVGRKVTKETDWDELPSRAREALKNRLAQQVREYRRENNLEDYTATTPTVYRRSFSYGFAQGVARQFRDMKLASEGRNTGSMEVALRDIRSVAMELYEKKWPTPPPPEVDPNAKPRRQSTAVAREVVYDRNVISRGSDAGRAAAMTGPGKGGNTLRKTPELPGS